MGVVEETLNDASSENFPISELVSKLFFSFSLALRLNVFGKLLVLLADAILDWKVMIARYKHFSLFGLIVSNEEKKFYNIDTWCQNFFLRHLRSSIIS
jgi:hypothetical protein